MAKLEIELLGARVLRQPAAPVDKVSRRVRRLIRDMFETMYDAGGVGLAAPQVGVSQRVLVVDASSEEDGPQAYALINPVVTESSEKTDKVVEGCLSIPGIEEAVIRPERVVVQALAENGEPLRIEAEGLLSRALQHEVDHLDGVLFIDRLSPLKRGILLKKWRKSRGGKKAG